MTPTTATMKYNVHWHTSPTSARLLEQLECKGPATPHELYTAVHTSPGNGKMLLRLLHSSGMIHIHGYRHNIRGQPTRIYALGPGKDKTFRPESNAERARKRRKILIDRYGIQVANKVLNRGFYGISAVVVDGTKVTTSTAGHGLAGTVSI